MKMRKINLVSALVAFALLALPAGIVGQDKPAEHGSIEFGVRYAWGDVYGRPDLESGQCLGCGSPFDPTLKTSKFNEYRDLRNGFYVRRVDVRFDDVLHSKNYVTLKSQRTLYRDQSYLATFGQYGKFKLQFRYDEIPHTYSNTTRTLFTETSPGVWSFPTLIRQTLQATTAANLPSVLNTQVVPQFNFITPSIVRKAGTVLLSYNPTAAWNMNFLFWRESQRGTRPIGLIMNSSPSASATAGYGVELPEPINYFNNTVRVGTEYGKRSWAIQAAYIGSFLQNHTGVLIWDNPFRLTNETVGNPLTGRVDTYPNNHANYLSFAGATDITKYLRFMGSITPGWLRQNDPFLPYTTNTANVTCGDGTQDCTSISSLPASSLHGSKQTLAMNFTLVTTAWKNVEAKATYRHYDYNNNTPILTFTPVEGDASAPPLSPADTTPFGYNRKNLELTGNWFFTKRSSFKIGYESEWMDRSHRDAAHSRENSFVTALDLSPTKDLLFRLSYRHSDRKPDAYLDDVSEEISGGIPVDSPFARRFDEAARLRDKADGLVQYSPLERLTLSAFGGTLQDDYNRAGGTNNATQLNFLTGAAATTNPYYLYGVLKDITYNYGFDADYAATQQVTFFAEYSHEMYHKRMATRYRAPEQGATGTASGCGPNTGTLVNRGACDSANNDWESTSRELVDISSAGADFTFGKKVYLTAYYSLSAVKGNVFSRFLGDPIGHPNLPLANDPDRFMLVGTNAAVDYPETVNRSHELAVIFKFKLTNNLTPKFEYRYQQWDNKDYQTSPMTQYMGCVSGAPPAAPVVGCTTPILNSATSPTPVGTPSPFYPYFVVGDPSAARYLFLGVDQPSFHAHYVSATLEYHF
ncbi:MAG: MtrB/PioB family outer membrane beta-barrel protein [Candidatus Acidiferrum sp.]